MWRTRSIDVSRSTCPKKVGSAGRTWGPTDGLPSRLSPAAQQGDPRHRTKSGASSLEGDRSFCPDTLAPDVTSGSWERPLRSPGARSLRAPTTRGGDTWPRLRAGAAPRSPARPAAVRRAGRHPLPGPLGPPPGWPGVPDPPPKADATTAPHAETRGEDPERHHRLDRRPTHGPAASSRLRCRPGTQRSPRYAEVGTGEMPTTAGAR